MKRVVFLMVLVCSVAGMPSLSVASDVNVSIAIGPPPLEFAGPPDVVVVPSGTNYVYVVPDMIGLYFYHGHWYRIHEGRWYRATVHNGPWRHVKTSVVPRVVVAIPPDYGHRLPSEYHRIHYRDLHSHWRTWDQKRHWHEYDWYRHEVREHERTRHADGQRSRHRDDDSYRGDRSYRDDRSHKESRPYWDDDRQRRDDRSPKEDYSERGWSHQKGDDHWDHRER